MTGQAVTANRLRDGAVVYLTSDGRWSERIADSHVAASKPEAADLLAAAQPSVDGRLVVAPYLFDVTREDGAVRPLGQRETIRAKGPSIRPDLGYQATYG